MLTNTEAETEPAIVDCEWGEWEDWGPCNEWCNENEHVYGRTRRRNRTIAQEAMNGGLNCTGDATELRTTGNETCTDDSCPICKEVINNKQSTSTGHLLQRVAIFTVIKNSPNKIFSIYERLVGIEAG